MISLKKATIPFCFAWLHVVMLAQSPFAGGTGSVANPYLISTAIQLDSVRNYPYASFILINDIDLTEYPNANEGWIPIGNTKNLFKGNFNGAGYTIYNLYINQPSTDSVGLFGSVYFAGIDSVNLVNVNITAQNTVGTLIGSSSQQCNITNSFSEGIVSGSGGIGGLIGRNYYYSNISNCHSHVKVSGTSSLVGGLVGINYGFSTITDSYAKCDVKGNYGVGGLVGDNEYSCSVDNCYSAGKVTGTSNAIGGLIGFNGSDHEVSNSYSTCDVTGVNSTGGLVGDNYSSAIIVTCYSTGNVSGNFHVGGLVGQNYSSSSITNSYSTGNVSGINNVGGLLGRNYQSAVTYCYSIGKVTGSSEVGGLVGSNLVPSIASGYYNKETSGQSDLGKGERKSTAEMRDMNTFAGWDFASVWNLRTDSTYPGLRILDDAPFAFRDNLHTIGTTSLLPLLINDFDIETIQNNLVLAIDTLCGIGSTDIFNWFRFPPNTPDNYIDSLNYRVGEVLSPGDTLWGGNAVTILINEQVAPTAIADILVTNEDTELIVPTSLVLENDFDLNNDTIFISNIIAGYPHFGSVSLDNDTLTYTPIANWNGTDTLHYEVSDGSLTDTALIIITVNAVNDAPLITSVAPITATVDQEYTYTVIATDIDDTELEYRIANAPAGMQITANVITWTPGEGVSTSGEVTLTVSDGDHFVTQSFSISVSPATGIESHQNLESFTISPNPAWSIITISSVSSIRSIKVMDVNGKTVLYRNVDSTELYLDINELEQGIFIVIVQTTTGISEQKLIRE
jgi:hypothetical protein